MPDSAPDSLRRVDAVANRFVEEYAALDSLAATYLGISGYDDKVNDLSPDGYQARESLTRQSLREVEGTEPVDERETAAKESLVERMTVTLAQYDARTPQPQVSVIFSELHARHARRPGNAGHPRHDRHRHASGAGDPAEQPGRLPPGPDVDACARAGLPAPALPIGRRHHQVRAQPLPRVPRQARRTRWANGSGFRPATTCGGGRGWPSTSRGSTVLRWTLVRSASTHSGQRYLASD